MSTFTDAFTQLRQDFDQAQNDRTQTIDKVRADVKSKAEHNANDLAEQTRTRQAEFGTFMNGLRRKVQAQAEQTNAWLAELTQTRHADFDNFMGDLRQKVQTQAEQTRNWLADLADDLRQAGTIFHGSR